MLQLLSVLFSSSQGIHHCCLRYNYLLIAILCHKIMASFLVLFNQQFVENKITSVALVARCQLECAKFGDTMAVNCYHCWIIAFWLEWYHHCRCIIECKTYTCIYIHNHYAHGTMVQDGLLRLMNPVDPTFRSACICEPQPSIQVHVVHDFQCWRCHVVLRCHAC